MRIRSIVIPALLGLTLTSTAWAADKPARRAGINAREHRQVQRIKDGVQDGQITRPELDRLHADEAAIRAEEQVYRQSGDGLTRPEVRDLEHDLNQTSREIARATHNNPSR